MVERKFINKLPPKGPNQDKGAFRESADPTFTLLLFFIPVIVDLGLSMEGHHHSGIDDCKTICKVINKLKDLGLPFMSNFQ
jgi:hypothetical protein